MEAVRLTVAVNGYDECYIRPLVYLTDGGWNLTVDSGKPGMGIAVWEWNNYLGEEALEKGIRANIASFTRHHPNVMMTKAKMTGNYANSVLAKTESMRYGFDEAIMLDPQGYVAECTGENLFLVRDGKIYTPPTAPVLEGITRDAIATLAHDLGLEVLETPDLARPALHRRRSFRLRHRRRVHRPVRDRFPHHRQWQDGPHHPPGAKSLPQRHPRPAPPLRRVARIRASDRARASAGPRQCRGSFELR